MARRERVERAAGQRGDQLRSALEQARAPLVAETRRGVDADVEHAELRECVAVPLRRGDARLERGRGIAGAVEQQRRRRGDPRKRRASVERAAPERDHAVPRAGRRVRERRDLDRRIARRRRAVGAREHALGEHRRALRLAVPPQPRLRRLDRDLGGDLARAAVVPSEAGGGTIEVRELAGRERRLQPQPRREWMTVGELEQPQRLVGPLEHVPARERGAHVEVREARARVGVAVEQRRRFAGDELEHALDEPDDVRRADVARALLHGGHFGRRRERRRRRRRRARTDRWQIRHRRECTSGFPVRVALALAAMSGNRAVCVSRDPAVQRAVELALAAVGIAVDPVDALPEDLAGAALVVVDRAARQAAGERLRALAVPVVIVGDDLDDDGVVALMLDSPVSHLVEDPTDRDLGITSHKLVSRDLFGLDKYLAPGTRVRERAVACDADRRAAIGEVSAWAESVGARRPVVHRLANVVDELLMNALLDAPAAAGAPGARAQLRFACDDRVLGVSVADDYGALSQRDADRQRAPRAQRARPAADRGRGAGLGLYFVLANVASLIVNVEPGRRTEVVCLFDVVRPTRRPAVPRGVRSLHVFV